MVDEVETFCRRNDLPWDDERRANFEEYLDLLLHFNQSMNLIGPLDRGAIVRELLIDSLTPAAVYPPEGSLLDVGSGAGLPGLPLKFTYPELPVTLVEPRRKRATFLRIATNRLDLDGTRIAKSRIEETSLGSFEYLVSKAFRPPTGWLEVASDYLSERGVAVCMTTSDAREEVEDACRRLDLERLRTLEDAAEIGAPEPGEETRAIYVVARRSGGAETEPRRE